MITPDDIADRLESTPGRWSSEDELQAHLSAVLGEVGFRREIALNRSDRLDLWEPESGIVVEVKVKGSPAAVLRQLQRYADRPEVQGIVLATTRPGCARYVPDELRGTPIAVARLWLWGLR